MIRTKLFSTQKRMINGVQQTIEIDVQMNEFIKSSNIEVVDIKYADSGLLDSSSEKDIGCWNKSALMIYKLITYKQ